MSLEKKIASGFRVEAFAKLSEILSGGLLIVILARLLDPEGYGLLFFAISIMAVATLISHLGFARSAARYVAEYDEKNPGQIPHIIEYSALFTVVLLAVVAGTLLIFTTELANFLNEPDVEPFLVLGVLFLIGNVTIQYARRVLQGFKKVKLSSTLSATDAFISSIAAVTLVVIGYDALGAFFGYVLSSLVTGSLGAIFTYREYARYDRSPIESGLRRRLFEYAMPLSLTASGDILIKRVDIILIGFFLTPIAVSYYTISKQVLKFSRFPASSLGFAISPRYKEQYEKGNIDRAARLYENALTSVLLVYIPATAGLMIVAEPTIELVFGAEYRGAVPVLQVLSLYLVAQTVTYVTSSGLDYLGQAKSRAYAKGGVAIANFVLNLLLIPTIGIVGAAISTVFAYSVYAALNVYIMHLELTLDWTRLSKKVTQIVIITLLMALVVVLLVDSVTGLLSLFAIVGLGGLVWLTLSYLLGFVEEHQVRTVIGR